jgi:hypothetical protein
VDSKFIRFLNNPRSFLFLTFLKGVIVLRQLQNARKGAQCRCEGTEIGDLVGKGRHGRCDVRKKERKEDQTLGPQTKSGTLWRAGGGMDRMSDSFLVQNVLIPT